MDDFFEKSQKSTVMQHWQLQQGSPSSSFTTFYQVSFRDIENAEPNLYTQCSADIFKYSAENISLCALVYSGKIG